MTYDIGDAALFNAVSIYTNVNTTNPNKVADGTRVDLDIHSINGNLLDESVSLESLGPDHGTDLEQLMLLNAQSFTTLSGTARLSWPDDAPNPHSTNSQSRVSFSFSGYQLDDLDDAITQATPIVTPIDDTITIDEGSAVTVGAAATDPGDDSLTYTWDFGDGSPLMTGPDATHTYADNGTYRATLSVDDGDGGITTQTLSVTVNNVAPTIHLNTPSTSVTEPIVTEQIIPFSASLSDPGILDTHTLEWDFGDGTTATGTLTPSHIYHRSGRYTVTVTATDSDGASTTETLSIDVGRPAPTIVAGGHITIRGTHTLSGDPLNRRDDTYLHGNKGLYIQGKTSLPVQRDIQGRVLTDAQNRPLLVEYAATVGSSDAPFKVSKQSGWSDRPSIASVTAPITVDIPSHQALVSRAIDNAIAPSDGSIQLSSRYIKRHLRNVNDWLTVFPPGGTPDQPTIVEIMNGSITIPKHVHLENIVLIVHDGDITFRGGDHTLNNVTLVTHHGKVNVGHVQSTNLSIFSSERIRVGKGASLGGNSLLSSDTSIVFKGKTRHPADQLTLVSQTDIAFCSSTQTQAQLFAEDDIVFHKGTRFQGRAYAKGNITAHHNVELTSSSPTTLWSHLE